MALPVTRSVTSEKGLGVGLGVVVGQSIGAHHIGERDCPLDSAELSGKLWHCAGLGGQHQNGGDA